MSSDEVYSSSVVGSVVDERGVEVFDHIVGSVTKKHLGVLWGIVDPVFKVEFGDLFVNFLLDVGVWDWAFENRVTSCALVSLTHLLVRYPKGQRGLQSNAAPLCWSCRSC